MNIGKQLIPIALSFMLLNTISYAMKPEVIVKNNYDLIVSDFSTNPLQEWKGKKAKTAPKIKSQPKNALNSK